jgi:hypothetical protein
LPLLFRSNKDASLANESLEQGKTVLSFLISVGFVIEGCLVSQQINRNKSDYE